MFGFISGPCSCFGKEENQHYRSYFCGLCNCLRQSYGLPTRLLINRDSTFLALLASSQMERPPESSLTTCCNPLGKKRPLFEHGAHVEFAAAVTICGLGAKLRDNAEDETFVRRWLAKSGLSLIQNKVGQAKETLEQYDFPANKIADRLAEQEDVEEQITSNQSTNLEQAAGPTASAFGEILAHTAILATQGDNKRPLRETGQALGKLIYWADAIEDFDADQRHKRFNAFNYSGLKTLADRSAAARELMAGEFQIIRAAFKNLNLLHNRSLVSGILLNLTPQHWERTLALPSGSFTGVDSSTHLASISDRNGKRKRRRSKTKDNSWWCDCCPTFDCPTNNSSCYSCGCDSCGCDSCACPCDC